MPTELEVTKWIEEVDVAAAKIAPRFSRKDLRAHSAHYLRGLISRVERKNGWQLAEELGEQTPTNLQHFIARSNWDADEVRDDLQQYVMEHLGAKDGILIIDETGFLKKGTKSVGVKRQYSGTAGRIENSQVGVFLAYRSDAGHALIDRSLYLPKEWAEDRIRRDAAKVPESITFSTKPALAREMLKRTLAAGVPAKWVTADEVYGSDSKFRCFCEESGLGYVVAISSQAHLFLNGLRCRVSEHVQQFSNKQWRRLSCGPGQKGERLYDWAYVSWPNSKDKKFTRGFLVRRSLSDPEDIAYFFTNAPQRTTLKTIVRIAGSRWAIEECFEQAKQETGLDEYEVRSWVGWHRHITLSMLAHATLSVIRSRVASNASRRGSKKGNRP
jgi:SRSO17 transposase